MKVSFKNILVLVVFANISLGVFAQKKVKADSALNRTITVENEYIPDLMSVTKVNVLPTTKQMEATKLPVKYEMNPIADYKIKNHTIEPFTLNLAKPPFNKGYLGVGYGNNGNFDLKAGYLFKSSEKDKWMTDLSVSGFNAILRVPLDSSFNWTSKYFRSSINESYQHLFKTWDLSVIGHLSYQGNNYINEKAAEAKTDKSSDFSIRSLFHSNSNSLPIQFNAEAAIMGYNHPTQLHETDIRLMGDFWTPFSADTTNNTFGLKFRMDHFSYSSNNWSNEISFQTNPYLKLISSDKYSIRLGLHADFANKGTRLQLSPDLQFKINILDKLVAYSTITGGREINDFYSLNSFSPYWGKDSLEIKDSYVKSNIRLGLNGCLVSGLWMNLYGGYEWKKNDLIVRGLLNSNNNLYLSLGNADTEHGYLGFDLKYDFEELFEVYASGLYNHWTNTSLNSLLQKKRFEWKLGGEYNFNRKLSVNADYNIIIYQSAVLTSGMYRMPAVNSLGVGMDYKLLNYLSVNAHISNLFNRRYQDFYGYPAQKLNFLVGVSFRF